jgi:hypothetical protein
VTNVRNVASPFWRAWLKPQYRCLVLLTSFSELQGHQAPEDANLVPLSKERPLAAFAGIWRPWTDVRGTKADPALFIPDLGAERIRRAEPSQGETGDPDDARGIRDLADRADGESIEAAAAPS